MPIPNAKENRVGPTLPAIEALLAHSEDYALLGCDPERRSWTHLADEWLLSGLQKLVYESVDIVGVFAVRIGVDATPLYLWQELILRNIHAVLAENWTDKSFLRSTCKRAYDSWPEAHALLQKLRAYITTRTPKESPLVYDDELNATSVTVSCSDELDELSNATTPPNQAITWQRAAQILEPMPAMGKNAAWRIVREKTGCKCTKAPIRNAFDNSPILRRKYAEHQRREAAKPRSNAAIIERLRNQADERGREAFNRKSRDEQERIVDQLDQEAIDHLFASA